MPSDQATYQVYGLTLASDFPFTFPLVRGDRPPDLRFACRSEAPVPDFWEQAECVYAGPSQDDQPPSGLYRKAGDEVLRFAGLADFYLRTERITCHLRDPDYAYGVEIWLLGTVLAYWMERRGLPILHASAVVAQGPAVAFLATNRGGKSSLAAALMQAGCPLLTDDLLPLDLRDEAPTGWPGYPQMRFWPDQAEHFNGRAKDLERVVPHLDKRRVPVGPGGMGDFCTAPHPLARLYLPERRVSEDASAEIEIQPISPLHAVKELVRHSFLPNLVEAAGLQPQRLKLISRMAQAVPLRRLSYPDGVEHLPRVREVILEDLRAR